MNERDAFRAAASGLLGLEVDPHGWEAVTPLLRQLSIPDRRMLRLLLYAFEGAAPLLRGEIRRLSSLQAAQREQVMDEWLNSDLEIRRRAAAALKPLAALAHYGRASAGQEIGYDGPWLKRVAVPVLPAPKLPQSDGHVQTPGILEGRYASGDLTLSAKVCVIGTGAGGAAAVARLAQAGVDVLAVEGGPHTTAADFTQQELQMLPLLYQEGGLRATENKSIGILQGRGVGGSTLHNTGLVYGPPTGILSRWRNEHGLELNDADVIGYSQWARKMLGASDIPLDRINVNNDVLRRGAEALGWKYRVAQHNRVDCSGCGYCMLGCAYNRKNNAALSFLPDAVQNGARIMSDAQVRRIKRSAAKCRIYCDLLGTDGEPTGYRATIEADTVIIAAGALDTPALLQRSGMGNGRVGRSLRLHPAALVTAIMREPVNSWRGLPQSVVVEQFASFMQNGRDGFLFIPSASNWPGLTAAVLPGSGALHKQRMAQLPNFASAAVVLHDETEGSVTASASGMPRTRYWPHPHDMAELQRGISELARLHFAAGAERVFLPYGNVPDVADEAELAAALRLARGEPHRIALNSVHPQGSCALGGDERRSACRPDGGLWGEKGVFVADTSLFPTSVGVPPQLTTMMLAAHIADHVTESL